MDNAPSRRLLDPSQHSTQAPSVNLTAELIKKTAPNLLSQISKQAINVTSYVLSARISKNASAAMAAISVLQGFFDNVNGSAVRYLNTLIGIINGEREGRLPDYLLDKSKQEKLAVVVHSSFILALGASTFEALLLRFLIPAGLKSSMHPEIYRLTKGFLSVYAFSPFLGFANQIFKYTNQSTNVPKLNWLPNLVRFSFIPLAVLLPQKNGLNHIAWAGIGASSAVLLTNIGLRKTFQAESQILVLDKKLWLTSANKACVKALFSHGFWYAVQEMGPMWLDLFSMSALIYVKKINAQSALGGANLIFSIISLWGFGAFSPGMNLASEHQSRLPALTRIHFTTNAMISSLLCAGVWVGKEAILPFISPDAEVVSLLEANLAWVSVKSIAALPGVSFASLLMGGYHRYKEASYISIGSFALGLVGVAVLTLTDNVSLSSLLMLDSAINVVSSLLMVGRCHQVSKPSVEGARGSNWCGFFNRSPDDRTLPTVTHSTESLGAGIPWCQSFHSS